MPEKLAEARFQGFDLDQARGGDAERIDKQPGCLATGSGMGPGESSDPRITRSRRRIDAGGMGDVIAFDRCALIGRCPFSHSELPMKTTQYLILAAMMAISTGALAANAQMQTDKQSVDQACTAEAAAANCGQDQVGTGLLKCIRAYKKANPGFKLSPNCAAAIKQLHTDHNELKQQPKP
jgi:hypothetical protein